MIAAISLIVPIFPPWWLHGLGSWSSLPGIGLNVGVLAELPKAHFHWHPYADVVGVAVTYLAQHPPAALKIDHSHRSGFVFAPAQLVDSISEDVPPFVGELIVLNLVFGLASRTNSLRGMLNGTTGPTFVSVKG